MLCRWDKGFNDPVRTGGCFKDKQLHELIKRDVDRSIQLADKKAIKLHQATTDHIGLELMHQFVLDLLGHDTSAAKIFIQKVGTNELYCFYCSYVVSVLAFYLPHSIIYCRRKKISATFLWSREQ